ncbi:MAG: hypothetical protein IPJ71_02510 [Bdellovibrionales bacterium]|nr:hypothetical protein [Bdellovibrionales bacterium]
MNPKISKFKIYFMISSAVQVSIIAISLILILTSMDGRALAKKAESASKLSDYLLSSSGFNQMSSEDQVRYSMFFAQFGYGLETIQNAPQDQLVKSPSHTKQESGYHRLEGLQSERWWFAALFGEEVFGSEPTRPRESACQAGSNEPGKPCVMGGHLSVFYDEVKNNIKIPKCRVPVEGT